MIYVVIAVGIVILFWFISTYNFFVSSKARIKASVQEIGNQLKRQFDLIPNLEESTKSYLIHEKGIYEALTDARKAVSSAVKSQDTQKMADAGSKFSQLLPQIQVVVESNQELKASEVIGKLMDELRDTSDKVMYARRIVIDLTADFNVKRVQVPTSLVAGIFKFGELPGLITPEKGEHLEVTGKETQTPKVDLG